MIKQFLLPDVGEGLTEAEIVRWVVAVGDEIEVNDPIVEIETAKSIVELPSPFAGKVTGILSKEGEMVVVGTAIIEVEVAGADAPNTSETEVSEISGVENKEESPGAVLVGYGTSHSEAKSRRRTVVSGASPAAASAPRVLAKPPIRKLARDLNVDLSVVTGTGLAGEITRDDVMREASQASVFRNIETPEWSEEREERIPVKGVRKAIATAMSSSAFSAPHVTVWVDVDATRTMEFVKRLKNSTDFAGVKVSPLLIMAKAVLWAVQRNPVVNSTWTDDEIVVHHYVNLGFAAATPRGLLVPNIKEAHTLSLLELARAIESMTLVAREGKTQPEDMSNGTITITNIGVFGMDAGTPILNPGEVGIVALGTIKPKPWVVDGEIRPRMVTTVAASFDHRVVDGDVASRFAADIASVLEEPALLLD
ncbi:MAG: 2-oxo acid dehydrogenase subunit E2 [Microbacteriaceae bacterium]|nr:2-oxo acid dehydrogenase subunit E2 [Microbacteriaceae bacterium]